MNNDNSSINASADTIETEFVDELVLQLRIPVSVGSIEYTELNLTEPTVAQLKAAQKAGSGIDQLAVLISKNAKVPPSAVDLLSQRDFEACARFFESFSAKSP